MNVSQLDSFTLELGQGSETAFTLTLFVMMLAVALRLKPSHFRLVLAAPMVYFVGLFAQIILLPLITLALCFVLEPSSSVALGMILVACCPGGNVSNLLVLLARGDIALSFSLTTTSSVMAAFVTPVSILFWSSLYPPTSELLQTIDFDPITFLFKTALVLGLPFVVGLWLNTKAPSISEAIRKPLAVLSSLVLVLIIALAIQKYSNQLVLVLGSVLGIVVLHNALAFSVGYVASRFVQANPAARRALVFEVGIQNSGLAIVIILGELGAMGGTAAVAGVWGVWHLMAGLVLVGLLRYWDKITGFR